MDDDVAFEENTGPIRGHILRGVSVMQMDDKDADGAHAFDPGVDEDVFFLVPVQDHVEADVVCPCDVYEGREEAAGGIEH